MLLSCIFIVYFNTARQKNYQVLNCASGLAQQLTL